MKIGVFSAGDRNNYGDILFPIIFRKYFKNKIDLKIKNYGVMESDLSSFGGLKTQSIVDTIKDNNDYIVVCGGETLGANWTDAFLTYDQYENKFFNFIFRAMNKIFGMNWNIFLRNLILGNKMLNYIMPYNLSYKMYNKTKIIYNSVGGSSINLLKKEYKKYIENTLNTAEYISVRDEKTLINLQELGVKKEINLFPDSAILMSDYFNNENLKELHSKFFKDNYFQKISHKNYIVFQIAENYAKNKIDTIVRELEKIYLKTKYQIVLLPIGKAAYHLDQIPLKKIYKKLKDEIDIIYVETQNIYETMYILGNTQLYIGTSLHGAITAFSFNRRHVALTNKVTKLREFLKTWSLGDNYIEIENLSLDIAKYLKQEIKNIEEKNRIAKEKATENFKNIEKIIKGKRNE